MRVHLLTFVPQAHSGSGESTLKAFVECLALQWAKGCG